MKHFLDNPVWSALISGNKRHSNGKEQVKYFDKAISPFVGFKENSNDNFRILHVLIIHNDPILFVTPNETEIPGQWKVLHLIKGFQMIERQRLLM